MIDGLKWTAAKKNPKELGDRIQVEEVTPPPSPDDVRAQAEAALAKLRAMGVL